MTHMLSADLSVYTVIDRKPSTCDTFNIHLKRMLEILAFLSKSNISIFTGKFLPHPLISMLMILKDCIKIINRDLVYHYACRLSHNI